MANDFDDFAQQIGKQDRKDNDDVYARKQYHCPDCNVRLVHAYLEQNPFPEIPCPSCGSLIQRSSIRETEVFSENERTDPRCTASLTVTYQSYDAFITEYTKNVSRGGMFVYTKTRHELGSTLELFLTIPGIKEPVKIIGEVVHASNYETGDTESGIGLKFIEMDEASRQLLIDFIKTLKDCQ